MENNSQSVSLDVQLEAILFAMGQETTLSRLSKITEKKPEEVSAALDALQQFYETNTRGLTLVRQGENIQLVTSARVNAAVEKYRKGEIEGPLSRAALETLAIIAYRGPLSKPEIDVIRGVNSGIMLRTLLIRGLVDRKKSDKDARTHVYSVSLLFLRHLGVTDVHAIPGYQEAQDNKVLEKLEKTAQEPVSGNEAPSAPEAATHDTVPDDESQNTSEQKATEEASAS